MSIYLQIYCMESTFAYMCAYIEIHVHDYIHIYIHIYVYIYIHLYLGNQFIRPRLLRPV
jgi:hypothetical protein